MSAYQATGMFTKKMFDVSKYNIKCKECKVDVKELPFMPKEDRLDNIYCRECNFKRKKQEFRKERF